MIEPPPKSPPNDKVLASFMRGAIYLLKSTHKSWKHCFVTLWEALQIEATKPQLHTFHMDLHSPTHVQLKLQMVDV